EEEGERVHKDQPSRDQQRHAHDLSGVQIRLPTGPGAASASARRVRVSPAAERPVDGGAVLPASEGEHRQGVLVGVAVDNQENSCRRCYCRVTGLHAGEA
ncbi:unnamed protein product, partial [Urochloa humidicola]